MGREWAEDKVVVEAGSQSVTCGLVTGMMGLGGAAGALRFSGERSMWALSWETRHVVTGVCAHWAQHPVLFGPLGSLRGGPAQVYLSQV